MEEQAKVPVWKPALIYGAIVGLATIVVSLIFYFMDSSFTTWAGIVGGVISYGLILVTLFLYRSEYAKEVLKYGRVVGMSVLIGVFSSLLISIYTFAIYSSDEGYLQDSKYYAIEKMDERMAKSDAKYQERFSDDQYAMVEDQMEEAREKAADRIMGLTPVKMALQSFFGFIFPAVLLGLVAGIFLRRKPQQV